MFPSKTEQNCCLLKNHEANGNYRPPLSGTNALCRTDWQMCCSSYIRPRYCTCTGPVASSSTTDAGQWVVQAFRFVIMQIASLRHRAAVRSEFMVFRRRHFDLILVRLCKASTAKVTNHKIADPGGLAVLRLLGFRGSNPSGDMDVCILWMLCGVGGRLCDGPITRPGESHRTRISVSVISCNNNSPLHLQWVGPTEQAGRQLQR